MTKVILVFLIVVAAVFVAVSLRSPPTGTGFKDWLDRKKDTFDRTPRVKMEEIVFPGRVDDILVLQPTPQTVILVAERRRTPSRKVTLTPSTPARLRVRFDPPASEQIIMPVPDRDCDQSHPLDLLVGESGGEITITQLPPFSAARIKLR